MAEKRRTFPWGEPLATGETPTEILETLYYEGKKDGEIAALLSVIAGRELSRGAATQKRQSMKLGKSVHGAPLIAPSSAPQYDEPPRIEGDALVMTDWHVPYHDAPWCNRCVGLAQVWGVRNLVIAGDFLDLNTLKSFAPHFQDREGETVVSLEGEFDDACRIFDALAGFEKILYISGGHELRLLRRLEWPLAVSRFARLFTDLPQLEMSAYHKCEIGEEWHVSHPKNVSVIPARVPFFLIRKHRKNCAIGHDHVWGMVQDESGTNVAVSIGVCCDPARLDYVALQNSTRPAVCQGALVIKDGYPWLLSPRWTDFQALRSIKW
jgi:hypothetical protein